MENGERLPALLEDATGIPLFDPMAYVLSEVRAKSRAANTIFAHLAAIELLLVHALTKDIDLKERISSAQLLDLHEADGLTAACRLTMEELVRRLEVGTGMAIKLRRSTTAFELVRMRPPRAEAQHISRQTAANRIRVIRSYLTWLINEWLGRLDVVDTRFGVLQERRDLLMEALAARIPRGKGAVSNREGLEPNERRALLRLVSPSSSDNPWEDRLVRRRNELIVHFLYHFGLRRGELLSIRIGDVDFRANTVRVVRRPDDPEDPRKEQPVVKTNGRVLPMNQGLADMAFAYLSDRRAIRGSARHPFLFVETDRGRPLSARGVANIFDDIRAANSELKRRKLSPHILRHDWNDRFSENMDRRGTAEPIEEKQRSHLMGWQELSGTAATYTRRHTRRKATETSLAMQSELFERTKA
jgi:integrase